MATRTHTKAAMRRSTRPTRRSRHSTAAVLEAAAAEIAAVKFGPMKLSAKPVSPEHDEGRGAALRLMWAILRRGSEELYRNIDSHKSLSAGLEAIELFKTQAAWFRSAAGYFDAARGRLTSVVARAGLAHPEWTAPAAEPEEARS